MDLALLFPGVRLNDEAQQLQASYYSSLINVVTTLIHLCTLLKETRTNIDLEINGVEDLKYRAIATHLENSNTLGEQHRAACGTTFARKSSTEKDDNFFADKSSRSGNIILKLPN